MKRSVSDLTKMAFVLAELWQRELMEATQNVPEQLQKETELAEQLKAYRLKRWGKSYIDDTFKDCDLVDARTGEVIKRTVSAEGGK